MATVNSFEELEVWQLSRDLCNEIFKISEETGLVKDFSLKNQINSSSGSVMDNIAEGFERSGRTEFRQFLSISKGSCGEVRSQLYRVYDRKYIQKDKFEELRKKAEHISKKLSNLIKYLTNSEIKGVKFKVEEEVPEYNIPTFQQP